MGTDIPQYCYECPICIENLGRVKIMSTPCHHFMHELCYESYKQYNINKRMDVSCPICKTELIPKPTSPIDTIIDIYDHHVIYDQGAEDENRHIMVIAPAFMALGILLWCAIIFMNLRS